MHSPAKSTVARAYRYRPPHARHELLLSSPKAALVGDVAPAVDWRPLLTPIRDQGREGDCFAFAGAALKEFNCAIWGGGNAPLGAYLAPSYLAWRVRMAEGTFPSDSGASLSDTMEVLRAWGCCPESFLPYEQDASQAGNAACDVAAKPYRVAVPCVVDWSGAENLKQVLSAKKVVAIGFIVYASFERTGADGMVPEVQPGEGLLGGHAVLLVGYDDKGWLIRNSWGTGWGDGGYCHMPYGYEAHFCEAWTA